MEKNKYYKNMFLIAALWNWMIGIIFFLLTIFMLPTLAAQYDLEIPPSLIFIHGFLGVVFVIGIGFFLVSRDITKNHGIVQMCVVEKFLVFILFLAYFFIGAYNFLLVIPTIIDLLFGILFLEFLKNFKKL